MIAKEKKPQSNGGILIQPCMLKAADLLLREKKVKILLLDSMVKTRVDKLAKNIDCQVVKKNYKHYFFSIPCHKTTDIAQLSQLLVYVRFNGRGFVVFADP